MQSEKLRELYSRYDIYNLSKGIVGDKLGDLFEEYVCEILNNRELLSNMQDDIAIESIEQEIFNEIIMKSISHENISAITEIMATTCIPSLPSGGNPKTDINSVVEFESLDNENISISVKQSSVSKVAMAEFDVDTIVREVGITNLRLIELMKKHQDDASAKNLTSEEKLELKTSLAPIAKPLVRWIISGSSTQNDPDIRVPNYIIKFKVEKITFDFSCFSVYSIEEYIDEIMLNNKGSLKTGGFGTGLSWTYATGSKFRKIQFKG